MRFVSEHRVSISISSASADKGVAYYRYVAHTYFCYCRVMAVIECRRINALPIAAFVNLICLTRSAPTDLQARLLCLLLHELQLPMCCLCCGWHCVKAEYSNSNGNRNRNRNRNRSGSSRNRNRNGVSLAVKSAKWRPEGQANYNSALAVVIPPYLCQFPLYVSHSFVCRNWVHYHNNPLTNLSTRQ